VGRVGLGGQGKAKLDAATGQADGLAGLQAAGASCGAVPVSELQHTAQQGTLAD